MTKPKASIIILDYHKSERVLKNVKSLMQQRANFDFEVIVVDNSVNKENQKKLEAIKKHKNTKLYVNSSNEGYIKGNQRGVARSKGEFLLIVNPDIVWKEKDTLQKLVDYMETNPEVGILGPKQINEQNGEIEMTVRAFPKLSLQIARRTKLRKLPILKSMVAYDEMQHLDYSKIQAVDWLQSSFWITRRKLWNQWGGFDNRYFIFMADPDLCRKCWKSGYEVIYYPEVKVYADGKRASTGTAKDFLKKPVLRQHLKDSIKFRIKHFGRKNPRVKN